MRPHLQEHAILWPRADLGSLRAHPVSFLRAALARRRVVTAIELAGIRDGFRVKVTPATFVDLSRSPPRHLPGVRT